LYRLVAILVSAAACGSAAPAPATLVAPPAQPTGPPVALGAGEPFFHADEQFAWEVRVHGILVGEAVMASGKPGVIGGRRAFVTRSRSETAGLAGLVKRVRDEVTTAIDMDRSKPIQLDGDLTFGNHHVLVKTEFGEAGYQLTITRDGSPPARHFQRMPGVPLYDSHAVMARIRGWVPEVGQRAYFYVIGGRYLWHNLVQLTSRETVRTALGTFPALRIDGLATRVNSRLGFDLTKKPRTYTVWLSDDNDRVPLRVQARTELGDLDVELVSYERPSRRLIARGH
jgi:uncharacterized protein DUF3108